MIESRPVDFSRAVFFYSKRRNDILIDLSDFSLRSRIELKSTWIFVLTQLARLCYTDVTPYF